jgi:hypothetical protein
MPPPPPLMLDVNTLMVARILATVATSLPLQTPLPTSLAPRIPSTAPTPLPQTSPSIHYNQTTLQATHRPIVNLIDTMKRTHYQHNTTKDTTYNYDIQPHTLMHIHPHHPNITRGLLIHKEHIDKILDHVDPKIWELRSKPARLGYFYLLETKGGGIRGHAELVHVMRTTKAALSESTALGKHKVNTDKIHTYVHNSPYIYVLQNVCAYNIPYTPPYGCVDWCVEGLAGKSGVGKTPTAIEPATHPPTNTPEYAQKLRVSKRNMQSPPGSNHMPTHRNMRSNPTTTLCWAMSDGKGNMLHSDGPIPQLPYRHVVLFAMHNLRSNRFRDSIRIQALLRCTSVTHISTMSQHGLRNCAGHNEVHFHKTTNIYPLLQRSCPQTIIWDWNFVPAGYIVDAYKINLFAGQVPGFFACGAHVVVMPNWVLREPSKSCLDKDIASNGRPTTDLMNGMMPGNSITFAQGLASIAPHVDVAYITISALEAETHHPLVAATIASHDKLTTSTDKNAASASWPVNKRYIGEHQAFFVFYDKRHIICPLKYLQELTKHSS